MTTKMSKQQTKHRRPEINILNGIGDVIALPILLAGAAMDMMFDD
jgi:hypothetical protein